MSRIEGEFLVLEDEIGHENFLWLAETQDWVLYRTYPADEPGAVFEEVWTTQDKANAIHYVEDPTTGTRHVWLRGPDLKKLLFETCRRLPAYEPEELILMAGEPETHDDAVDALFRIAVAFPNFDPRAYGVFEIYLDHPDPLIRKAAVQAAAYRLWPESFELLERAAAEDEDEEVREFAEAILEEARG